MQTLPHCPSPQVVFVGMSLCWALVVAHRLSCPEPCEISVPQQWEQDRDQRLAAWPLLAGEGYAERVGSKATFS